MTKEDMHYKRLPAALRRAGHKCQGTQQKSNRCMNEVSASKRDAYCGCAPMLLVVTVPATFLGSGTPLDPARGCEPAGRTCSWGITPTLLPLEVSVSVSAFKLALDRPLAWVPAWLMPLMPPFAPA